MKKFAQIASLLVLSFTVVSCANQQLATPSGRPEVTVKLPLTRAQNVAISRMSSDGFTLTSQSPNALIFERDLPPAQAAILLAGVGNTYNSKPKAVIRLTFVSMNGGIKILATVQASTQGPFGQIKSVDMTGGKAAQELQAALEAIKGSIR